jgi:hypothetical protein
MEKRVFPLCTMISLAISFNLFLAFISRPLIAVGFEAVRETLSANPFH